MVPRYLDKYLGTYRTGNARGSAIVAVVRNTLLTFNSSIGSNSSSSHNG